jgi:Chaperone of endosialidase
MTPDEIKRLRYYEKQYLRTQDFQDEQAYHIEMRRRHSIAHHNWGIVTGLEIQPDPISNLWAVQPGMAVDGYGREIVVFEPEELNLVAIANQLLGQSLPALLNIWIAYTIEPTNRPAAGYETCNGKDEFTRIQESFQLVYRKDLVFDDTKKLPQAFQDLPDDPKQAPWYIYLGTITWNSAQNIITAAVPVDPVSQKGRRYVGVVAEEVIAPDNQLLLRGRNKFTPPTSPTDPTYDDVAVKLAGTLQITNYLTVGPFTATTGAGGIDVTGAAAELGFVKRTLTSWPSTTVAGDRFVWYNPDGSARLWTEQKGDLVTVTSAGFMGINTITPTHIFHVLASEAVGLFESSGPQAYLRFQTNEGVNNRVEITNRPGGRLSLWTAGGGDVLNITRSGNVGIGTITPALPLDIQGDFGRNNGPVTLNLWGSRIGDIGGGVLFLNSVSSGTIKLDTTGGTIELNATQIKQNGFVIHASSRELKQNITALSTQESVELLTQLNSVKFNYKADSHKRVCLGFIAEEIPDAIATTDRKGFVPTDILALLTKVVQEQQKAIATLTAKVQQLESQLEV